MHIQAALILFLVLCIVRRCTFYEQQLDPCTLDEQFTLFITCDDAIILDDLQIFRFRPRVISALSAFFLLVSRTYLELFNNAMERNERLRIAEGDRTRHIARRFDFSCSTQRRGE